MIGIITIVKVNNYGAELQAFALQKKLELLGYRSEIIDYLYYKNWKFKDTNLSKPFAPMSGKEQLAYWLKYRLANFVLDKVFPLFHQATRIRLKRFEKFHRENTKFSRPYHSMIKLYRTPPDYDTYIVGSDQVWNPSASSSIEPYFLTFAPKDAKKISYASSFGVSHIAPELQERFKKLLNNIDVISVRETSGVELVKQLTGRNAELVVDPTLLLNKQEWMPYMQAYPNMPERYVLIYQLSDSDAIVKLAKQIGIENIISNVNPEQKLEKIKELNKNNNVAMVGDGINDSPSLKSATVGISVENGTDISADSADVILLNENMNNIVKIFNIGKRTIRIIKENLFWALFYNICMIPLATGLLPIALNPMIASLAMTLSSLTVVLNSLRLLKK